jgi:hypothetical protein
MVLQTVPGLDNRNTFAKYASICASLLQRAAYFQEPTQAYLRQLPRRYAAEGC